MATTSSKIGIFWIMENGQLLVSAIPCAQATQQQGNYLNYGEHYNYWEKEIHGFLDKEYTEYPRGRVVYNIKNKTAKIITAKAIAKNKKQIAAIAKAFCLKKYSVATDEHYEQAQALLEEDADTNY